MSVRLRATAAAVAAASLSAGLAAVLPATAHAATTVAPASAVKLTATQEYGGIHQLLPGQHSDWPVIIKAVNTSAKPQTFSAQIDLRAVGAVNLRAGEVLTNVVAWGKTPATGTAQETIDAFAFFPKGHQFGTFTIPAHATYTWKAEISATKAWPMNDNHLAMQAGLVQANPERYVTTAPLYTHVGVGNPGGTMNETLVGSTTLNAGGPAYEKLTLTNHTGATLKQTWSMYADVSGTSTLATDVWVGSAAAGHWRTVPFGTAITVPAGLANGASVSYRLRVRLVHFNNTGASHQSAKLSIVNADGNTNPAVVSKSLIVLRSGI